MAQSSQLLIMKSSTADPTQTGEQKLAGSQDNSHFKYPLNLFTNVFLGFCSLMKATVMTSALQKREVRSHYFIQICDLLHFSSCRTGSVLTAGSKQAVITA